MVEANKGKLPYRLPVTQKQQKIDEMYFFVTRVM